MPSDRIHNCISPLINPLLVVDAKVISKKLRTPKKCVSDMPKVEPPDIFVRDPENL